MAKNQIQRRLDKLYSADDAAEIPSANGKTIDTWEWELDKDSRYLSIGSEVFDCLGIAPEKFLGKTFYEYLIPPQSGVIIRSALEEKTPGNYKVYFQPAENSFIETEIDLEPKFDSKGKIISWLGQARIISLRQTEEEKADVEIVVPTGTSSLAGLDFKNVALGIGFKEGEIHPADHILTKAGRQSLIQNKTTIQPAKDSTPTAIATPLQIRQQPTGVIEIIDERPDRTWKEDERLLIQEIATQLGMAIENAQLYQAAQLQLEERIKAEQETIERNEQLAALNRAGQRLNRLASSKEIYQLVHETIGEIADNRNLTIAISDDNQTRLTFPLFSRDGKLENIPDRPFGKGIIEYIISTGNPLMINSNIEKNLDDLNLEYDGRLPASLLGVPMLLGGKSSGVILLEDENRENAYTQINQELLSTLAFQVSTSLENANLFSEVTTALQTIEKRERYQAAAATAVATLSDQGTKMLSKVFETLADVTESDRIYFAKLMDDEQELYWQIKDYWVKPGAEETFQADALHRIPVSNFPNWAREFVEKGWSLTNEHSQQSPELSLLRSQNINSSFKISVSGKNAFPSYLAFEQIAPGRLWLQEEINALQVIADALANTITREDLLKQLQTSLDESEDLYEASHKLALANEFTAMVSAVATGVEISDINRGILVLFDYDQDGSISKMTVEANWHNGIGTPPPPIGSEYPASIYANLFLRTSPIFIDDISEAPIDNPIQKIIADQNVASLAVLPLQTGARQIGVLLFQSEVRHRFGGREKRAYPPLADQMTTAVENLRLFAQTQSSLAETELLYKVTNEISQAVDAQDLVRIITQSIMPKTATRTSLMMIVQSESGEPSELELVGFYDLRGQFLRIGTRFLISDMPIITTIKEEPLVVSDARESEIFDPVSQKSFQENNILGCIISPLRSAGKLIGLMLISSNTPTDFEPEEVRLIRVIGGQISVTLEKQRLLREAQRRALELRTAAEIARDTVSTLSVDTLLSRIVNQIYDRFTFYQVALYLMDESGENAVIKEAAGEFSESLKTSKNSFRAGDGSLIGQVTLNGEPIIVNDISASDMYDATDFLQGTKSEIGIPLQIGEKIVGALDIHSDVENAFTPDDVTVLRILADQIAVSIENARAFELSQKAVDEMHELDQIKNQFLANMSHELRTPLNSIIGFSRVILKGIDGPINDTQAQDLTAIYNSGQHLLSLINNILDISKIDSGKMDLKISEVSISDIINSAMTTATGLAKDKDLKFKQIVPPELPKVMVDPTRIRQVLINFLSNAIKFTEQGMVTVEASTTTSPDKIPELMVTVTDTGQGIDIKDRHKLFQAFSQVDDSPTRKAGGTGLGLSISKSLIELHGGRIGLLSSEVGKGSTFFFTIPIPGPDFKLKLTTTGTLREPFYSKPKVEQANEEEVPTTTEEKTEPEIIKSLEQTEVIETKPPEVQKQIILSIDEKEEIFETLEKKLADLNYGIIGINEPENPVMLVKEHLPDLITVDISMSRHDGWQIIKELKSNPDTKYIPIMIVSIMERREKGLRIGGQDYLVKPLLQESLLDCIERYKNIPLPSNILLIDDNPEDIRIMQTAIQGNDRLQILTAKTGEEGLKLISTLQPDAIILDLNLPDMNSFDLLQKVHNDFRLRHIPVTILAGIDINDKQENIIKNFNELILSKPNVKEMNLQKALEESLRNIQSGS